MSNPIEAAFDEWFGPNLCDYESTSYKLCKLAFAAGVSHAAKANTELIKEYQETMEKKG